MLEKQNIVLIGASTGGPGHIKKILPSIDHTSSTIYIIIQHMSVSYMSSFTSQLNSITPVPVLESTKKLEILPSHVYICTQNSELFQEGGSLFIGHVNKDTPFEPSIDLLFESAMQLTKKYTIIAIVLTGIGADGAKSSIKLHDLGAITIAESEESAIVYGMPKQTFHHNKDVKVLHLDEIIRYLGRL